MVEGGPVLAALVAVAILCTGQDTAHAKSPPQKVHPPVCTHGQFNVQGPPLIRGVNSASVTLDGQLVTIGDLCPGTPAAVVSKPKSTVVKAHWRRCPPLRGRVQL